MANRYDEDDLFKDTSMTFGEHLEELRACLFKAVVALAIGFSIGLLAASWIVRVIQSPMENALRRYYSDEAIEYVNARVPVAMRDDPAIRTLVFDDGLIPQEAYIAPADMLRELKTKDPQVFSGIELPRTDAGQPLANATTADPADSPFPVNPQLNKSDLMRLFIWKPLSDDDRLNLKALNPQEPFMIYIKAAFLFGAIISSPAVFYFLWSFVAAGLYPHEKRYVHMFLPISVGLFASGALLAFTLVFPPVLRFFFGISKAMGQEMQPRISEWLSFVLLLPLGFGISFQLPLVMLFLERIHVFSVSTYVSKWRIAVLLMAIASMVLSPGGDPYSMLMMLVPLVGLYFGGIGLCKWLPSDRRAPAIVKKDRQLARTE
jgi:sec-independent protein translocase protein TatC